MLANPPSIPGFSRASNAAGVQGDVSNLADLDRLFAQIKRVAPSCALYRHFGKSVASRTNTVCSFPVGTGPI